jgi:hypothetical protein
MNFVEKATETYPRTRLMVGLYDIDRREDSTWYHWDPDRMDLALRFGVNECPTLAIVPPEYAYPENKTVDPIIWDRQKAWVTWLKDNVKRMKQPYKSTVWTQKMLETRDESEYGEWVRCGNYPPQLKRYTKNGYHKMKMPEEAKTRLLAHYNKHKRSRKTENWRKNQTQTNFHEVPMTMVELDLDRAERDSIGNDLIAPILQEWTKTPSLKLNSFYGIREYHRGSELHMHIDRMESHAISGILNLAQEGMEEEWMLQVVDANGEWKEVATRPGDMVLYESSTVIHGRPKPLKGELFVNAFVHFSAPNWQYWRSDLKHVNAGPKPTEEQQKKNRVGVVFRNEQKGDVDLWWDSGKYGGLASGVLQKGLDHMQQTSFDTKHGHWFWFSGRGNKMAVLARVQIKAEVGTYLLRPDGTVDETRSKAKGKRAVQKFLNSGDSALDLYWVREDGVEKLHKTILVGEKARFDTFVGHRFHVKKSGTSELVQELLVKEKDNSFVHTEL